MNSVAEIIWQDIKEDSKKEILIEKVIQECFEVEKINATSFYICVTLTNPENIKEINKKYRNIDSPTDVLSFPMYEKEELDKLIENNITKYQNKMEKDAFQDILGDIIISIEQVEKQAKEYGHSVERELAYMVVHGFYHLRGYDHIKEEDKIKMREKEENVLSRLNINR